MRNCSNARGAWAGLIVAACLVLAAAPAGAQSVHADRLVFSSTCEMTSGSGSPEGAVTGKPCDVYLQSNAGSVAAVFWVKMTGTDTNTGWQQVVSSSALSGSGTSGQLAQWTGASTLGDGPTAASVLLSTGSYSNPAWLTSITESIIADGSVLARLGANETISGTWTFSSLITGSISGNAATATALAADPADCATGHFATSIAASGALGCAAPSASGYVTGSGTSGYIPKWTGSGTLGDSILRDTGAAIGIGRAPAAILHASSDVYDAIRFEVASSAYGFWRPDLVLGRSRGTTASPAAVVDGDELGRIRFRGYDGSSWVDGADVLVAVTGTPGTNDMPTSVYVQTTADGSADPVTAVAIASTGNVGVGTTSPGARRLNVSTDIALNDVALQAVIARTTGSNYGLLSYAQGSGADQNIALFAHATGATSNIGLYLYDIAAASTNWALYSYALAQSYFAGSVGIGNHLPASKLHVTGYARATNGFTIHSETDLSDWNAPWYSFAMSNLNLGGGANPAGALQYYYGLAFRTANGYAVLDISGNFGLGTLSPGGRFQVNAASGAVIPAWFVTNDWATGTTGSGLNVQFGAASGNTYTELGAFSAGGSAWNNLVLQRGGGNVGIGITSPPARLSFAAATTAAGGIDFGGDTSLYRLSANVLITDDYFVSFGHGNYGVLDQTGNNITRIGTAYFGTDGDTNLYRYSANRLATDDAFYVDGNFEAGSSIYHRLNILALNKAGTNWVQWATRDTAGAEAEVDLTYLGSLTPRAGYSSDIGTEATKFRVLNASELKVDTLVAQSVLATIGGRIVVADTTLLTADLAAAGTTLTVKHNNLASGDRIYLEGNAAVEWMSVDSGAGGSAGAYTYTVTRNLDGSGANDWYAGDAVMNSGTTGDGFIDLYSERSLRSATEYGPAIAGNVRTGTTFSDTAARWAIGNLNGLYGYSTTTYGAAFGDPSNAWLKIDATNGIRIGHNATTKISLNASGDASFTGSVTATTGAIGGFTLAANTLSSGTDADYVGMSSGGTNAFWAGDSTFADAEFSVTAAGALKATSATITGSVTSTTGAIGGFTLAANTLSSGTDADYVGMSSGGTNAFWAGDSTFADAEFSVTAAGALKATSATITGTVNATAGYFGTASTDVAIDSDGITVGSTGRVNSSGATAYGTGTGFWLGYDSAYKWRVGDPSGDRFAWDGSTVTIVQQGKQLGEWTSVTHSGSNFTAPLSMTWTVDSADQYLFQYMVIGKTMTVNVVLRNTSIGGTLTKALKIKIPASKVAAKSATALSWIKAHSGASWDTGEVLVLASGDYYPDMPADWTTASDDDEYIWIFRSPAHPAFPSTSTDATHVQFSITFEIM